MLTETEAEQAILEWVRRGNAEGYGHHYVMRCLSDRSCAVLDLATSEPVAGSTWERRDKRLAIAATWLELHAELGLERGADGIVRRTYGSGHIDDLQDKGATK